MSSRWAGVSEWQVPSAFAVLGRRRVLICRFGNEHDKDYMLFRETVQSSGTSPAKLSNA